MTSSFGRGKRFHELMTPFRAGVNTVRSVHRMHGNRHHGDPHAPGPCVRRRQRAGGGRSKNSKHFRNTEGGRTQDTRSSAADDPDARAGASGNDAGPLPRRRWRPGFFYGMERGCDVYHPKDLCSLGGRKLSKKLPPRETGIPRWYAAGASVLAAEDLGDGRRDGSETLLSHPRHFEKNIVLTFSLTVVSEAGASTSGRLFIPSPLLRSIYPRTSPRCSDCSVCREMTIPSPARLKSARRLLSLDLAGRL